MWCGSVGERVRAQQLAAWNVRVRPGAVAVAWPTPLGGRREGRGVACDARMTADGDDPGEGIGMSGGADSAGLSPAGLRVGVDGCFAGRLLLPGPTTAGVFGGFRVFWTGVTTWGGGLYDGWLSRRRDSICACLPVHACWRRGAKVVVCRGARWWWHDRLTGHVRENLFGSALEG